MKPLVIKCNPDESGDIKFPVQNLEDVIDLVYKAGLADGNKVTAVLCKDCTNYDSHGQRNGAVAAKGERMYESPIQMISEDIIKDIVEKQDGVLLEVVHRVGFDVNKEELERALLYDRNQWERGYIDGKMDGYHLRDVEIVRCKDCKWWDEKTCSSTLTPDNRLCLANRCYWRADDFCSYGERREDAEVH